ncbi:MAG: hypothetical protein DRO93_07950 [Candidatus Thorarchaeota archaeon]|nr:MAG: hypothetical protein DRO93_07950 [Candidatus Thorarchaeota archaeon]
MILFTRHALERMRQRHVRRETVVRAIEAPELGSIRQLWEQGGPGNGRRHDAARCLQGRRS